jgi:flavin reductase (DIM6/NTAB) family NADH-FMN oxidoreductase RutF
MLINFENLSEQKKYKYMSNSIFPRPIAWISSEDEKIVNLAPFSYFSPLSSEPPLVIVSIATKDDGNQKDTFANIIKTQKCVINLAHKELLGDLINSAQDLPKTQSEADFFGIEMNYTLDNFPPMVKNAQCALFCTLYDVLKINENYQPLILKIESLFVNDNYVDEKNHFQLDNIGRAGMNFLADCKLIKN